ncbi:hypothetical protein [Plantactinospora endophytica]|uniref:Uncharacterized protein n=1 Tax=Plantactinospora endophytica TaxID=673535 RepID=A0ABQ4DRN8_9ACTN|nr:hypothetical protein [Plantactinospora endophytica]GIG85117.1 hypothetical protein Pen02_00530 [Plantactinospora endophytica]
MTNYSASLSDQDKITLRTAGYGAVELLSIAGVADSPHKIATNGFLALTSATGLVGHVLAEKPKGEKLNRKSAAALADQVLPALTDSMHLLKKQDPAEADNFRNTVIVAVNAAAGAQRGEVSPPMAEMIRKITEALDAA